MVLWKCCAAGLGGMTDVAEDDKKQSLTDLTEVLGYGKVSSCAL